MSLTGPRDAALRFTPRSGRSLGEVVVHDLVSAIVTGEFTPGQLLPTETELCTAFGVSRTVIRESVKRLQEKGLVSVVQGRGTVVTDAAEWNILDRVVLSTMIENDVELGVLDELAEVRAWLEDSMTRHCAEVRTDEQLSELTERHRVMVAARDDHDEFSRTDVDFHAAVMAIAGDRLAQGIARTLVQRASEHSRFHGARTAEAFALTIAEHEGILEAIADRDPELAGRRMHDHIVASWERRRIPR